VALLVGNKLWVANAGDSEAVLARRDHKKDLKAVVLSQIHKPHKDYELERLQKAGAEVRNKRIQGYLSVSRGFGDADMKLPRNGQTQDWVTAEPFIQFVELTEAEEFIILGCDGVWDVVKHQEAVDIIAKQRKIKQPPFAEVDILIRESLDKGSLDNITAIVIYTQKI